MAARSHEDGFLSAHPATFLWVHRQGAPGRTPRRAPPVAASSRRGERLSGSFHPATTLWTHRLAPLPLALRAAAPVTGRRPAAIAAAAALAMLAADGAFGATITETYLYVRNSAILPTGNVLEHEDELVISEGESIDATSRVADVLSTTHAGQYPREPNNIAQNFISSELDAYGNYGLGSSAVVYSPMTRVAEATYSRTYRNDGTTPDTLVVGFTIPRLEASIGGYASQDDLYARASAFALYEVRDAQDNVVGQGDLFDYWLEAFKWPPQSGRPFDVGWMVSDNLADLLIGPTANISVEDESYGGFSTTSIWVSPFSTHVTFDALQPGESVMFLLAGEARLQVGVAGAEGGGQALVGDPFDISGPQGPVFNLTVERDADPTDQPAAVPVPAAAWLLATGLLSVFALRRSSGRERRRQ